MEFFNPNARILEGKLQFPLGAGQVVSGFALDIDGQMRDAVPVEKARAEQVFEDIARRRVDPGLLQTTLGNNYELRVYPLNPGKSRTVVLTLVEAAPARLLLPLAYAASVPASTSRSATPARGAAGDRERQPARPRLRARSARRLRARRSIADATLPRESLRIHAPAANGSAVEVTTEERNGETSSPSPCRWPSAARRGRCRRACRSSGTPRARAPGASSIASRRCSTPTSGAPATTRSRWCASPTSPSRRSDSASPRRLVGAAPRPAGDGVRRRQQPRRGAPRRRLGRGPVVQRRPGELRRALAAVIPGAGVHDRQHRQRRPGGPACAGRGKRRPQHRPAGADATSRRRACCSRAAPNWSRRVRSARRTSPSSRARRPPAG